MRDQFEIEIATNPPADLAELNRLFTAWVEGVYHRRTHTETGETPLDRFDPTVVRYPTPAELHETFLWSEWRTVTKVATVSLFSNNYEVDPALAGQRVELVFDPFDLTDIDVRHLKRPMGKAIVHKIGRHSHPGARPDPTAPAAVTTGIDYLRLVETQRDLELANTIGIGFHQLTLPDELLPKPKPADSKDNPL